MSFDSIRGALVDFDMPGRTVLDLGGYQGEFASVCIRRGAKSATVVDSGEWREYAWSEPHPKPPVRYVEQDLMTWQKPADIVLLMNVLYHSSAPLLMLEHCRKLTREFFCICCPFVPGDDSVWRLYHPLEDNVAMRSPAVTRPTLFWKPTISGLLRMLDVVGFAPIATFGPDGDHICYRCAPIAPAADRWVARERAQFEGTTV